MLDRGYHSPATSPYAAGLVLVPKKNGTTRVCTDYRKLNEQTEKDAYPLPLMEELLEKIAGHERYTTLDLNSGYWQIPNGPRINPQDGVHVQIWHLRISQNAFWIDQRSRYIPESDGSDPGPFYQRRDCSSLSG